MSALAFATTPEPPIPASAYVPGVCNIGSAEIGRRRRAGHVALLAAVGLLGFLLATDAPPVARLLVILPAAGAASGYLQARLRFCAGFGSRGIFNFGELGETTSVADADAQARDRRRSRQIGLASLAIGVAAGVAALLVPL